MIINLMLTSWLPSFLLSFFWPKSLQWLVGGGWMDGARQSPTSDGLTNEPTDKVNSRICKSVESSVVLPLQQVSSGTSTTKGTNRKKKHQTNQKTALLQHIVACNFASYPASHKKQAAVYLSVMKEAHLFWTAFFSSFLSGIYGSTWYMRSIRKERGIKHMSDAVPVFCFIRWQ